MPETSPSSENQTILEPWTITSLKAYLELKITSLAGEVGLKFEARDKALKLQGDLNEEHFKSLNNEAGRLLKNVEITVSRDMWEAFQATDREWKARIDLRITELLTLKEFTIYKEGAERALNLGAGKWQGALQLVSTVASFAAVVGVAFALLK